MAEIESIETRIVSGTGVLKFGAFADLKFRQFFLYFDVIRLPNNEYVNFKHSPIQSFYANVSFVRDDYVIDKRQLEYRTELWTFVPDIAGQGLIAQKCALDAIFTTFSNLAASLGIPTLSTFNPIAEYTNLSLPFTELRFNCYSDAAIRARLFGVRYDTCDPNYDDNQPFPPPPPPEPGSVPRGQSIRVSSPYGDDNDDGNTVPNPIDKFPEDFPLGDECAVWNVNYRIFIPEFPDTTDYSSAVFAPVAGFRVLPSLQFENENWEVQVLCRGLAGGSNECQPSEQWVTVLSGSGSGVSFVFTYLGAEEAP